MDSTEILHALWRKRLVVSFGVVLALVAALYVRYEPSVSPLRLKQRSTSTGAARAILYMDYGRSILTFSPVRPESLNIDAQIAARLVDSGAVRGYMSRVMGITPSRLSVAGPFPNSPLQSGTEPSAQQRANQITGETSPYSVYVTTDANLPTITIFAQAPTGRLAIRLANAAAGGISRYLADARKASRPVLDRAFSDLIASTEKSFKRTLTPAEVRVRRSKFYAGSIVVRSAGSAVGGAVSSQVSGLLMIAVFLGIIALWSLLILLAVRLRAGRSPSPTAL